jgi:hypothetical protein
MKENLIILSFILLLSILSYYCYQVPILFLLSLLSGFIAIMLTFVLLSLIMIDVKKIDY